MNNLRVRAFKILPRIFILSAVGLAIYNWQKFSFERSSMICFAPRKIQCISLIPTKEHPINNLVKNVIKIVNNDAVVGYAYCFAQNCIVSMSFDLFNVIQKNGMKFTSNLKFYQNQQQIRGEWEIIGQFEGMSFIKIKQGNIKPMNGTQLSSITPVQISQKRSYLSINNGYFVSKQGGFGIVDGRGEVGSIISTEGLCAGIVNQIGRDSQKGFLKVIEWKALNNIARRLKQQPIYLGISVKPKQQSQVGLSIVRIASNSPLQGKVNLGDNITKVNGYSVTKADDLLNIIMMSGKQVAFEVESSGKSNQFRTTI